MGEVPGVFLESISGGDKEEVTPRASAAGGGLELVPIRTKRGDRRTEWDEGGRVMRRELHTGQIII